MNCEIVKDNLVLHLYGELPDDERFALEQHLGSCAGCEGEWRAMQDYRHELDSYPALEPSPNLLAACRIQFHDKLETIEPVKGWRRFVFDPVTLLRQARFSPALAAAILIIGFTAGALTTFSTLADRGKVAAPGPVPQPAIAAISGVSQDPNGKGVQIKYDTVQQQSVNGSLDDPKIEQLLLYASRNQQNPGVRVESVDLLTQKSADPQVREALIYTLRYDQNPGCRLKALEGLENYVKSDLRVRDAITEAVLYDSSSGLRIEAIRMLQPVKADSSVRAALGQLKTDPNLFIRNQSQRMLASVSNIQ